MLTEDMGAGLAGSPGPWQHGAGISFLIMKRQVLCLSGACYRRRHSSRRYRHPSSMSVTKQAAKIRICHVFFLDRQVEVEHAKWSARMVLLTSKEHTYSIILPESCGYRPAAVRLRRN